MSQKAREKNEESGMDVRWEGVFPAVTTKFLEDERLDIPAMERHFEFQISAGVHGLVVIGSLGENGSLTPAEKLEVVRLASRVSGGRVPVIVGVAETTTAGACRFAADAARNGADGFMVLPPMQYAADPRETIAHLRTVAAATDRPIMIYNNPVAYRVDVTPEMFAELADEPKFQALKESSDNVRRITDILNLVGRRYRIFSGVDDLAMESLMLGADGWVAGLVCAFPAETVAIYRLMKEGRIAEALPLYRWFTPLLHLDTDIKFIHYIKFAETLAGIGTETMRKPRLPLAGDERERVSGIIRRAIATRPTLPQF
jgi:dihydrodipicolinate synthase/N-acetylneuraminate lyase